MFLTYLSRQMLLSEGANVTSKTSNVASKEVNVASKETNVASNKEANVASSNKLRMSKGDLEDLIMENCKNWISREELAVAVHRNETYLRNHILKDMIKEETRDAVSRNTYS